MKMKIKKISMSALFVGILGLGSGLMLSGCSGVNSSLEKAHIMNDGCFITCYNKTGETASAGNARRNVKAVRRKSVSNSERIYG